MSDKVKAPNKSGFMIKNNVERDTPAPKMVKGGDLRTKRSGK